VKNIVRQMSGKLILIGAGVLLGWITIIFFWFKINMLVTTSLCTGNDLFNSGVIFMNCILLARTKDPAHLVLMIICLVIVFF